MWACFLQHNDPNQCNTDLLVGFSENNSTNWDFKNNTATALYTVNSTASSGSIVRCAPAVGSSTTVSGLQYEVQLFVTGTGAGTSSDQFVPNNGCASL